HAHSVEAWKQGRLAGGLYGVAVGGAFFGESMFHRVTDASKIALVALVEHLRARKFVLLDTQWLTPHLQQFGGVEISRHHYLRLLRRAVELPRKFLRSGFSGWCSYRPGAGAPSKPPFDTWNPRST